MAAEQDKPTTGSHNLVIRPQRESTARQRQFAQLVATGKSQAEAYRRVFNPNLKAEVAAARGYRTSCLPWVEKEIERFRAKSDAKKLLTYNDRLEILAKIAQDPDAKKCDRISATMGYSKLAGDQPPERQEISGPNGGPIVTEAVSLVTPIQHINVRSRISLFRQRREQEAAASPGAGRN